MPHLRVMAPRPPRDQVAGVQEHRIDGSSVVQENLSVVAKHAANRLRVRTANRAQPGQSDRADGRFRHGPHGQAIRASRLRLRVSNRGQQQQRDDSKCPHLSPLFLRVAP